MKILIIKTGITETFDTTTVDQKVVSLGDVLRTTVILNLFKTDDISWFTSPEAFLLLDGHTQLRTIYQDVKDIEFNSFDLVFNFERESLILSALAQVPSKKIRGFYQSEERIILKGEDFSLELDSWLNLPMINSKNWCEKLFLLLGHTWRGENYLISLKHLTNDKKDSFDIGLNWKVGIKWPSKTWPKENWESLEKKLEDSWSVTWQEGFSDLIQYMNWINSARILVTHDSLGLHIARALNKKILALFGPTSANEIYLGDGIALSAPFSSPSCYSGECHNMIPSMKSLSIGEVEESLRILLQGPDGKTAARWK